MSQDQSEPQKINPIRETSPEAIRLAKTLIRTATFGALAVLDPQTGFPLASRVAVATDSAGAPIILISSLSAHSKALRADDRCSILVGEPGKGDPVAHPRVTVICKAQWLDRDDPETSQIQERYLRRQPKANLYVGFADFSFVRLQPIGANLNGGFGKAFVLSADDLLASPSANHHEKTFISDINRGHSSLVTSIGKRAFPAERAKWTVVGIDEEGLDLMAHEASLRLWYDDKDLEKASLIKQIQWLSSR
jgi:heme iron utilization protein